MPELLATGWRFHQAGDLPRAEEAYRQLVEQEPENAQGWYLLGALCQARGDLAAAAEHLTQALELHPAYPEALNHQGVVFIKQGRFAEATTSFREALRLKPQDVEIQTNLATVLAHQGQQAEALALLQAALHLQPNYARAQTLFRKTRAAWEQIWATSAGDANDAGVALLGKGRLDDAAASFRQALRQRNDFPEAYNNLGYTLASQGRLEEAIACYQQALRLRPGTVEAHNNLGNALRLRRRALEAEASYREAIRLGSETDETYHGLGVTLLEQFRLDEAIDCFQRAVHLQPCMAAAHNNLGSTLWLLGRFEEALASYAKAMQAKPDYPDAHWNAGLVWLQLGNWEKGWSEHEWRWRRPNRPARTFAQPPWEGCSLAGRTILLYAEQGLGDTIQFIRYARVLHEQGATVIVECQRALLRLLARCPGIDRLVAEGDPLPPYDVRAPLMSVPYHLGTRVETIPAQVPYLSADPVLVKEWGQRLTALSGFKIGINWQGNPESPHDAHRSVNLKEFTPLAQLPGVQLVSLQHGPASDQLRAVAGKWPVTDLGGRLDEEAGPFMDRAAVMQNLDLLVSTDTSIPHLAGALGVPVWLALGRVPDWRWLLNRADCPWYPTMRLFRQERPGDWAGVFRRIAEAIRQRMQAESGGTRTSEGRPVNCY
jgi:tetratricopeptide (TPR) repeat protein